MRGSEGDHSPAAALAVEAELGLRAAGKHFCQPPNLLVHVTLHADAPWFARPWWSTPQRSSMRRQEGRRDRSSPVAHRDAGARRYEASRGSEALPTALQGEPHFRLAASSVRSGHEAWSRRDIGSRRRLRQPRTQAELCGHFSPAEVSSVSLGAQPPPPPLCAPRRRRRSPAGDSGCHSQAPDSSTSARPERPLPDGDFWTIGWPKRAEP